MFSRLRREVIWLVPVSLLQYFCPCRSMEERATGVCGKPAVPPLLRNRVQPLHGPAMNLRPPMGKRIHRSNLRLRTDLLDGGVKLARTRTHPKKGVSAVFRSEEHTSELQSRQYLV